MKKLKNNCPLYIGWENVTRNTRNDGYPLSLYLVALRVSEKRTYPHREKDTRKQEHIPAMQLKRRTQNIIVMRILEPLYADAMMGWR